MLYVSIQSFQKPYEISTVFIPTLQVRKQRHREVKLWGWSWWSLASDLAVGLSARGLLSTLQCLDGSSQGSAGRFLFEVSLPNSNGTRHIEQILNFGVYGIFVVSI